MNMLERMTKFAQVAKIEIGNDSKLKGLELNEEKYGIPTCPTINLVEDLLVREIAEFQCPCNDAFSVARGHKDMCYCGLFVSRTWKEEHGD